MAKSEDEFPSDHGYPYARRGVLYRLAASPHPEQRVDVVDSIVHNLRALLNSDRGIAASSPEFGLSLHQSITQWQSDRPRVLASIAALIRRFEPRLSEVEIEEVGTGGPQRFSVLISATLEDGRMFKARSDMAAFGGADVQQLVTDI